MRILVNASKEKAGGGIQVSDSICQCLNRYPQHDFVVVVSEQMHHTYECIKDFPNVEAYEHTYRDSPYRLLTGRYLFFDKLVEEKKVDAVLTVFGPCRWTPRVPHLCGFAMAQILLKDSPYFVRMSWIQRLRVNLRFACISRIFRRSTRIFYSENPEISKRVEKKYKGCKCYTVTNYYNQVFDFPQRWHYHGLPPFDGVSLLIVSTCYPHKNLEITIDIARYLREVHPEFKFRFVMTVDRSCFPQLEDDLLSCFCFIGKVDVSECPSLYEQCDIEFQPTLIECFTATYPEAMRMNLPIVTTDLPFARGLCGEAAAYFSPLDSVDAAKKIYHVAMNKDVADSLIKKGTERLTVFDDYYARTDKLIGIMENLFLDENWMS